MSKKILIMAGGTGGHIFPALAIAKELKERGAVVEWLGGKNAMESRLVPRHGYKFHGVSSSGLRGKNLLVILKAFFLLGCGFFQTVIIFIKYRPNIVIGMGGYASGIGGLISKLFFVPLFIHEQNSVPGTTNRLLSRLACKCFQAFEDTFPESAGAITTGNPILFNPIPKNRPKSVKNLLVLGGSLGAKKINQTIPQIKTCVNIWHQTGENHLEEVRVLYKKSQHYGAKIEPFIENMAEAYAWADLVISRAGAMTISELIASNSLAILIPFPYAIDNHQKINAEILSKNEAGILLEEENLNPEAIDREIEALSKDKLHEMAKKLESLKVSTPEQQIADNLLH
jgi:UDP-N-acetylglucosamine--N-acetylmuramyl-(pentapeptide) pyrophosphoryl-undecaprenol N-acetylglucosamine transferase